MGPAGTHTEAQWRNCAPAQVIQKEFFPSIYPAIPHWVDEEKSAPHDAEPK